MSPPLLPAFAHAVRDTVLAARDTVVDLSPLTYFCRRRSIVSTTPADDATGVAVGTSITVKIDDSIVSVKAEGAIEVRLHTAHMPLTCGKLDLRVCSAHF